jgi:hypothetical protein
MNKMAAANHRLHQLLGLRLRFCLRGKYSDIFNSIFQINFVDLFGQCSQQQLNASGRTLAGSLKDASS